MELREWQRRLLDGVRESLKGGKLICLQSPTGSGKTLFSLKAALSVSDRVIFAVRTHNQYYPVYRELKTHFPERRFSFLVGKALACPLAEEDVDSEDVNCKPCPLLSSVHLDVNSQPFQFLQEVKRKGKEEGFCPYHSLVATSMDSDVVVLTYPYLFIQRFREGIGLNFDDAVLIVDEAHNLDWINEADERTLSLKTIEAAISQAKSDEAKKILQNVLAYMKSVAEEEDKYVEVKSIPTVEEYELDILDEEYQSLSKRMIEEGRIRKNYVNSVLKFLRGIKEGKGKLFSYGGKLVLKYLDPSIYLSFLNDRDLKVILMSGTMPPEDYIREVWGISRELVYVDVESRVNGMKWGQREFIVATDVTSAYSKRGEYMWRKYASYLLRIYHTAEGAVLALAPSYEIVRKISGLLGNVNIIVENQRTTIEEVSEAVKKGKLLILGVVRGKLSEGIEITENGKSLISDVAILGVPYPVPDDYVKARNAAISSRMGKDNEEYSMRVPALIAVKQAIGRAVRSEKDRVRVWLLDKRFDSLWWKIRLRSFNPKKIRL